MPPSDSSHWLCSTCGRRVPSRVASCRCGASRAVGHDSPTVPATRDSSALNGMVLLAVGLVLGAAIALPAWWRSSASEPRAAATTTPIAQPSLPPAPAAVLPPPEAAPSSPLPSESVHDKELSLEDLVARAVPAVASIQAGNARGTRFFVRPDAIVTNAHVVDGQAAVT